jgi:hypothetical protein
MKPCTPRANTLVEGNSGLSAEWFAIGIFQNGFDRPFENRIEHIQRDKSTQEDFSNAYPKFETT